MIKTWENLYQNFRIDGPAKGQRVHMRRWKPRYSLPREYRWMGSREQFYDFFDSQYSFSYVRDPIPRYLSGFFEYMKRGNDKVEQKYMKEIERDNNTDPKHLALELAKIMEHRMICEWNRKFTNLNSNLNNNTTDEYKPNILSIYWDDHMNPQMHFLLNDKWDPYQLNYVGYIEKMEETLYKILIQHSDLHPNDLSFDTFKEKHFEKARDRHTKKYQNGQIKQTNNGHSKVIDASELVIEAYELESDLIQMICELYWMDYICLPFDIPQQCNLTDLFLQHYGEHVVYNDCYQ